MIDNSTKSASDAAFRIGFASKLFGLLAGLMATSPVLAIQTIAVQVEDRQVQGLMREHQGRCFMIAPKAALTDVNKSKFSLGGAQASLIRMSEPGDELSIVEVVSKVDLFCTGFWDSGKRVPQLLEKNSTADLYWDDISGVAQRVAVKLMLAEDGAITAVPAQEGVLLAPEMLGAQLKVQLDTLGMLTVVDPETGVGTIERLDRLSAVVQPFFSSRVPEKVDMPFEVTRHESVRPVLLREREKLRNLPYDEAEPLKVLVQGDKVEWVGDVVDQPWVAVRLYGMDGYLPRSALDIDK